MVYLAIFIVNLVFFIFIGVFYEKSNNNTELLIASFILYGYIIRKLEMRINYIANKGYLVFSYLSMLIFLIVVFYLRVFVYNLESIFSLPLILLLCLFLPLYVIQYYGIVEKLIKNNENVE